MITIGDMRFACRGQFIASRNEAELRDIAKSQADLGAHYLYLSLVNLPAQDIRWCLNTVQEAAGLPLCLDIQSAECLEMALELCRYGRPIINAGSLEKWDHNGGADLAGKYGVKVICPLTCCNEKPPANATERLQAARTAMAQFRAAAIEEHDVFLDPVITPICTNNKAGQEVVGAVQRIRTEFPLVNLVSKVSGISFGLPGNELINRAFMVQLMTAGMNAFIMEPLDKGSWAAFYTSKMLLGHDPYCREYLAAYRRGII